jgi:hypothetical protein
MPIRLRISSVGNDPATVASTCESSSAHRRQRSDEARSLRSLILRDPDRDAGRHQKGPLTSVVVRNGHPATSRCVRSDGLHGELGGWVVQPDPQVRTIMQASHGTAPSFDLRARYVARRPTAWKPPEMTSTHRFGPCSPQTIVTDRDQPSRANALPADKTGVLVAFSVIRCYVCNIVV